MKKLFFCLVALLLVPCLIADPTLAAALSQQQSSFTARSIAVETLPVFNAQALESPDYGAQYPRRSYLNFRGRVRVLTLILASVAFLPSLGGQINRPPAPVDEGDRYEVFRTPDKRSDSFKSPDDMLRQTLEEYKSANTAAARQAYIRSIGGQIFQRDLSSDSYEEGLQTLINAVGDLSFSEDENPAYEPLRRGIRDGAFIFTLDERMLPATISEIDKALQASFERERTHWWNRDPDRIPLYIWRERLLKLWREADQYELNARVDAYLANDQAKSIETTYNALEKRFVRNLWLGIGLIVLAFIALKLINEMLGRKGKRTTPLLLAVIGLPVLGALTHLLAPHAATAMPLVIMHPAPKTVVMAGFSPHSFLQWMVSLPFMASLIGLHRPGSESIEKGATPFPPRLFDMAA